MKNSPKGEIPWDLYFDFYQADAIAGISGGTTIQYIDIAGGTTFTQVPIGVAIISDNTFAVPLVCKNTSGKYTIRALDVNGSDFYVYTPSASSKFRVFYI